MKKKINYMGLSVLMMMSIIFVTFCLNLKKNPTRAQRQRKKKKKNFNLTLQQVCIAYFRASEHSGHRHNGMDRA